MPMQEFLASYAVQVDEDGARRLQRILEQNRTAAKELTTAFTAANAALNALKKNLSDASGLKNIFSSLTSGSSAGSSSLSSALSGLTNSLSGSGLSGLSGSSFSGGSSVISIRANLTEAEDSLTSFRTRLEAERPKLSANATGITSAVSSAIASIRSMMSSVRISVPVTAVATLNTSGLKTSSSTTTTGKTNTTGTTTATKLGIGGRVAAPTLAMIAEEGEPEYVIPTGNESRAVPLLRSLFSELSESARLAVFSQDTNAASVPSAGETLSSRLSNLSAAARSALLPAATSGMIANNTVQAPVNIHVTASGANAESIGRSIYDTAQRSLLKTLKGVFV